MNLKDHIRSIKDYPKKGILFRDITTLIKNEKAFEETINQIVEKSKNFNFDKLCSSPKPVQQPHPAIVVGGNRPPALRRVARFGDGWHPMNLSPEGVTRRLAELKNNQHQVDHDSLPKLVQVRLDMNRVNRQSVSDYQAAGVTDLVMHVLSSDVETQKKQMDKFSQEMFR